MTDENKSPETAGTARVVIGTRFRNGALDGKFEIQASTKHGSTTMLSVLPPERLEPEDVLVTDAWILGARNFVVVRQHARPMKLPGVWYEVRITKPQEKVVKKAVAKK